MKIPRRPHLRLHPPAHDHSRHRRLGRTRIAAFFAVLGPGIIAGLSDDDPAGITTYSIIGARSGYALIWALILSTAMLILFHSIAVRLGAVSGKGLSTLVRERYGAGWATLSLTFLLLANLGTLCAEYAGIAAAMSLFGIPIIVSVPAAAVMLSALVTFASFHRVERVLIALSIILAAYIASGLLARPDWGAAIHGAVTPSIPGGRMGVELVVAMIGTTLAPWGLSFIQSYAVDKKLDVRDIAYERIDVITGAVMTGVIGFFIIVACAATLNATGMTTIDSAKDAALALKPLAGSAAGTLFAVGLAGAALLAAAVVPVSTGYSVAETFHRPAHLDSSPRREHLFFGTFGTMTILACSIVLIPHMPLIALIYASQVANAILLVPLLIFVTRLAGDSTIAGELTTSPVAHALAWVTIAVVGASVSVLGVMAISGA